MSKILFIVATHGNETIGLDVIKKIALKYPKDKYNYSWVIGNPKAFSRGKRFIEADLNRSSPGDLESTIYEERRAFEILKLSKSYDLVIDIHGSNSNCGIVTIITDPKRCNLKLAESVPIENNVIWFSENSKIKGPITQHAQSPSIEIECGPMDSARVGESLRVVLEKILEDNLSEGKPYSKGKKEYFEVYGKIEGTWDGKLIDFNKTTIRGESFYPFMSSQYLGITCYKMRKVSLESFKLKIKER